jgi:hypothetical protein
VNNGSTQIDLKVTAHRGGWKFWLLPLLVLAIAFAVVAIPVFLIMPFKPQTERALTISYALKSWSPVVTIIAAIATLALVVRLWRGARWWRRAILGVAFLLILPPTWFARQNHFEWMFNPLAHSAYTKASEASFAGNGDMVLAVKINNEAVAYPVRLMAYHHVVQDTVGGTPICATY